VKIIRLFNVFFNKIKSGKNEKQNNSVKTKISHRIFFSIVLARYLPFDKWIKIYFKNIFCFKNIVYLCNIKQIIFI